jgi:hypothetical protein
MQEIVQQLFLISLSLKASKGLREILEQLLQSLVQKDHRDHQGTRVLREDRD